MGMLRRMPSVRGNARARLDDEQSLRIARAAQDLVDQAPAWSEREHATCSSGGVAGDRDDPRLELRARSSRSVGNRPARRRRRGPLPGAHARPDRRSPSGGGPPSARRAGRARSAAHRRRAGPRSRRRPRASRKARGLPGPERHGERVARPHEGRGLGGVQSLRGRGAAHGSVTIPLKDGLCPRRRSIPARPARPRTRIATMPLRPHTEEPAWPRLDGATTRRVVFLLDASSALEKGLLLEWIGAIAHPARKRPRTRSSRFRPRDGGRSRQLDPRLEAALASRRRCAARTAAGDLAPAPDRRRTSQRLRHLLTFGDPRDPSTLRQAVADPAPARPLLDRRRRARPASELRERWRTATGATRPRRPGLAEFVRASGRARARARRAAAARRALQGAAPRPARRSSAAPRFRGGVAPARPRARTRAEASVIARGGERPARDRRDPQPLRHRPRRAV